ncbi:proteasome assembly chaperone family protein [Georgenia sp. SYP-B2076]|uniref:proteasome assembly chaperone family protein n=1 Tax=Georgenia sp. SYP-B2076 TaxID=2495881 RepID=UPI000F8E0EC6|nr:PAC2 family protein [Georgenia sp. SYP-B2076]
MRDPLELYTMSPRAYDAAPVPVLVHAMRGSLDAGHAGALVARHLLDSLPVERIATFDADALVDYRSRRPPMTFEDFQYTDYEEPVIALDLLRDDEGTPLLLLHGPEPDLRWDAFTTAVISLVEDLGVQRTIGVQGIPMAVPHTRPVTVTSHATRGGLVDPQRHMMGTVQVPGNIAGLLELRLGRAGHDALGFAANVPHYLAQAEYPSAAAELVRQISGNTGLALPVGELEAAAAETMLQIEAQISASSEVGAVVHALEQQYDAYMEAAAQPGQTTLLAEPGNIPTADEIGAELEAFLAEHKQGAPETDEPGGGPARPELPRGASDTDERPADGPQA